MRGYAGDRSALSPQKHPPNEVAVHVVAALGGPQVQSWRGNVVLRGTKLTGDTPHSPRAGSRRNGSSGSGTRTPLPAPGPHGRRPQAPCYRLKLPADKLQVLADLDLQ
ncbi:hypothetical protein AB5J72_49165 [Streptomyces sp. CG1]|uniref:hypothetical protein n=1 Tax=Streptomyces sp. CG1 TaxID=1287523 RepID=UPI0034E22B28